KDGVLRSTAGAGDVNDEEEFSDADLEALARHLGQARLTLTRMEAFILDRGWSSDAIARRTGLSVGGVDEIRARAHAKLRRVLGSGWPEETDAGSPKDDAPQQDEQ